ncbi:MAG TPA: protein kinase [Pirellulaceae bacterium]|nr:protein kinase [Pirellulaceae bacterium]
MNCSACHEPVNPSARFCNHCGAAQNGAAKSAGRNETIDSPAPSSRPARERFAAGTVIAGRYRIVAALGKGGMGEVYRADDLTLGQSVALKFLPPRLTADADRLRRLRDEVKTARQVSHPHVCRVYDLGESQGQSFLTMEYIDGQDLASLLKQVGRLPEERGVEIARQICLGLGATHDQGVLHRDLKPANILLDGRGQVRLSDYGLALVASEVSSADVRDGTPAYQSPEQSAGKAVTLQSDIFALGAILYELFTGRRPFAATTVEEFARRHAEDPPSKPSSHITQFNAAIERIILRCLEKNPADRPRSAYEVLSALPGGDPLQAAIAAGETPSPELVANAAQEGVLAPWAAFTILAVVIAGIFGHIALSRYTTLYRMTPMDRSPRELGIVANEILKELGHEEAAFDTARGISISGSTLDRLRVRDKTMQRWTSLATGRPATMYYWHRQSPDPLVKAGTRLPRFDGMPGRVSAREPAHVVPGMTTVCLDMQGRLVEFAAVPDVLYKGPVKPSREDASGDWKTLFDRAGLAQEKFSGGKSDGPALVTPPVYCDEVWQWSGAHPQLPSIGLQVVGARRQGKVCFFHVGLAEGTAAWYTAPPRKQSYDRTMQIPILVFTALILSLGAIFSWRNWRLGRANVRGALWIAGINFAAYLVTWSVASHHVPDFFEELDLLVGAVGGAAFLSLQIALAYLAIEPAVRRRWPWRVVAWNRLLAGRWRDPLVGRSILIGALTAVATQCAIGVYQLIQFWLGYPLQYPFARTDFTFQLPVVGLVSSSLMIALLPPLAYFLFFFILFLLLRREWLTIVVTTLFLVIVLLVAEDDNWWEALSITILIPILMVVLFRYGLLVISAHAFVSVLLTTAPLTLDASAWYFDKSLVYLAILILVAAYGCVFSLGSRPNWSAFGRLDAEAG